MLRHAVRACARVRVATLRVASRRCLSSAAATATPLSAPLTNHTNTATHNTHTTPVAQVVELTTATPAPDAASELPQPTPAAADDALPPLPPPEEAAAAAPAEEATAATPTTDTPAEVAEVAPTPDIIPLPASSSSAVSSPEGTTTTASPSAPAAFNAAAAAAAAAGLPPPAVTTATTIPPTETNEHATPSAQTACPESTPESLVSQSPPAGFPLPFPPTHLLWMANGTQSTIADLFLSPPAAPTAVDPAAAAAPDAVAPVSEPAPQRLVLVVGFVGAYLSVCQTQLPSFSQKWSEFRKRGIDSVYGVSVNDHAVLKSFAEDVGLNLNHLQLIADQDATFVQQLHLAIDLSAAGMGVRANRFVMLVREGFVEEAWVETSPGDLTVSSAESVLKRLPIIETKPKHKATTKEKVVAAVQAGMAAVSDKMEGHKAAQNAAQLQEAQNAAAEAAATAETNTTDNADGTGTPAEVSEADVSGATGATSTTTPLESSEVATDLSSATASPPAEEAATTSDANSAAATESTPSATPACEAAATAAAEAALLNETPPGQA